ncbi:MAG: hypothetical protein ABJG41_02410, partial [Cyclobacteriaceae bacterium]
HLLLYPSSKEVSGIRVGLTDSIRCVLEGAPFPELTCLCQNLKRALVLTLAIIKMHEPFKEFEGFKYAAYTTI